MNESKAMDFPELDIGLALSKAEGNLNFLAEVSNSPEWQGTMTQGMAILDALNAVQEARKKLQVILHEQRKK
tara:strand:+ start:513 stop:728 length:216 start_codon:yes stop_codon:yes gene_type:complete